MARKQGIVKRQPARATEQPVIDQFHGQNWSMYHGDCVEILKGIPDASIDMCLHSPPFASLYIYSDSERDLGNCTDQEEFLKHYQYVIRELYRVTVPGRICAIHVKDLPKYANVWDTTGLIDFPGACIQEFESVGWVFHSRVTIWKCPVLERERTNNNGLLHKTVKRDSSQLRMGMADYLICFRKPPEAGKGLMSTKPVVRPNGFLRYIGNREDLSNCDHPSPYARKSAGSYDPSIAVWRRYAEPVWWDIDQTDVLNHKLATSAKDARHICPLQLGYERAIEIWSLPGDVVLSPFAGVGSEGVMALRSGRKFVGIELKQEYVQWACTFLEQQQKASQEKTLFNDEPDTSVAPLYWVAPEEVSP